MTRQFKTNPVRRVAGNRPWESRYKPAPHILAYWPKFEAQVRPGPTGRGRDFSMNELARCQLWTGKVDPCGWGYINIAGRKENVQKFAYEYHFELIPKYDYPSYGEKPVHMVARCVAAGTHNCVAKDHLGIVHAREPYCLPITPAQRKKLRWLYYEDGTQNGLTFESLAAQAALPEARLARILVGLEAEGDEEFVIPFGPRETR